MVLNEQSGMYPDKPRHLSTTSVTDQAAQLDHLLKVAGAVVLDANKTWAELWAEFKQCVGRDGNALPQAPSFVPACGWPEFLDKVSLLKHYLDSIHRICNGQR
jgi:hypothetical protein